MAVPREQYLSTIKYNHKKMTRTLPTRKNKSQRQSRRTRSVTTSTRRKSNPAFRITQNVKLSICEEIESTLSVSPNGRYPKGALKAIIDPHLSVHGAWLTRTMIVSNLRRRRAKQLAITKDTFTPPPDLEDQSSVAVAGRPKGSTKRAKDARRHKFEDMGDRHVAVCFDF